MSSRNPPTVRRPAGWPAAGNSVYGTYQDAYRYFDYGMDPNIISTYGASTVIIRLGVGSHGLDS